MRVRVRVTPRAKHSSIIVDAQGTFLVKVTAAPESGRANEAVREALAEHFQVPKRAVTIVRGLASRQKLVDILP